jgi:hypothetical protein
MRADRSISMPPGRSTKTGMWPARSFDRGTHTTEAERPAGTPMASSERRCERFKIRAMAEVCAFPVACLLLEPGACVRW